MTTEFYYFRNGRRYFKRNNIMALRKVNGAYTNYGYDIYVKKDGKWLAPETREYLNVDVQYPYELNYIQYLGPLFKTGGKAKIELYTLSYPGSIGGRIDVYLCNRKNTSQVHLAGVNVNYDVTQIYVNGVQKFNTNQNKKTDLIMELYMDNPVYNYIKYKTTSTESSANNLSGSISYNIQDNNALYLFFVARSFGAVSRTVCMSNGRAYYD